MVRAYPRRLFNIQAVDGVSITLSFTLISVLYCNNQANGRPFNIRHHGAWWTRGQPRLSSIPSHPRAEHTPDRNSHFSSSLLKLKILVEAQQSRHCASSGSEHGPFLSSCPNNGGNFRSWHRAPSHPCVILSLCNSLYCGLPHVSVSYFMISNLFWDDNCVSSSLWRPSALDDRPSPCARSGCTLALLVSRS